jgi:hypothetical protein
MEVRPDCRHQEAKSNGFDVKVIREIVWLRKQDQKDREELDELLDVYLRAIKGASRVSKAAQPGRRADSVGVRPAFHRTRRASCGAFFARVQPSFSRCSSSGSRAILT